MKKPFIEISKSAKIKNLEKECLEIIRWNWLSWKLWILIWRRWCKPYIKFSRWYWCYEVSFLIYTIYFWIE